MKIKEYPIEISIYKNGKFIQNGILATHSGRIGIFFNKAIDFWETINEPNYVGELYTRIKNWGKYVYMFDEVGFYTDPINEIKYFNTKSTIHQICGFSICLKEKYFEDINL